MVLNCFMSNRLDAVANFEPLLWRISITGIRACDRSRTINSRLVVGATKGCQEAGEPCPCKTGREFSRVRARAACCTRALLTPAIIFRARSPARRLALPGNGLPGCSVGRQSRWAGSGIPRRARVSGTHRRASLAARKLGKRFSRGRSPRLTRTLPRVEEDILAKRSIAD